MERSLASPRRHGRQHWWQFGTMYQYLGLIPTPALTLDLAWSVARFVLCGVRVSSQSAELQPLVTVQPAPLLCGTRLNEHTCSRLGCVSSA